MYSNLCDNMTVVDSSVPGLYNVPIALTEKQTDLVGYTADKLMYVKTPALDTDIVEIDIRRCDGERVVFRGGRVVITVHLRRRAADSDVSASDSTG